MQISECRHSIEEDRPEIDFELPENTGNDWLRVGEVHDGSRSVEEYPCNVRVTVADPDAGQWDCYMIAGTRGLFSIRFVDVVGSPALRGFSLLPVALNGLSYFLLRCDQPINCLDRTKARFETFRSDATSIKRILHYAFHEDRLPKDGCFCLPEIPNLLLTDSVANRISLGNLRGLTLMPLQ